MNIQYLKKKLSEFPRVKLMWGPTPIVYAENISKDLGINLYIKRDDLTGLALGGNKTRKLEFIMGKAVEQKYDTVITAGALHSNHALQTAAAAKKLGMDAVLVLRGKEENKGNYFMDKIIDADTRVFNVKTSKELRVFMDDIKRELATKGKKPLVIPVGGSDSVGALGYINAAIEINEQLKELNLELDYVVSATSSGGTQAGTTLGYKILAPSTKILNIGVGDPREELLSDVYNLIEETQDMLGIQERLIEKKEVDLNTIDGYGFGGYGTIVREVVDLIRYVAKLEGFYLDPVYTGKAFYGLMDLVRKKVIPQDSNVLFIHTGGLGGLFQYDDVISELLKF
ncbi:D-cysteine desulfhydrase family protein [Tepidanaerobacter sp. GT38]|uniref:D-cysteine desulfhydrase family protein n=1 Tax=Tepidanaerobacter sp. GT38 TaxID=2722793 RepID=UPI001F32F400|nr:D-cysteine desulfhydrase family protein [Tepidanaerobacter sp. GT38]MCG1011224.1 D-cysteine desulfhydrase family protein [Tepidanaerobacter sp. GT38]